MVIGFKRKDKRQGNFACRRYVARPAITNYFFLDTNI